MFCAACRRRAASTGRLTSTLFPVFLRADVDVAAPRPRPPSGCRGAGLLAALFYTWGFTRSSFPLPAPCSRFLPARFSLLFPLPPIASCFPSLRLPASGFPLPALSRGRAVQLQQWVRVVFELRCRSGGKRAAGSGSWKREAGSFYNRPQVMTHSSAHKPLVLFVRRRARQCRRPP